MSGPEWKTEFNWVHVDWLLLTTQRVSMVDGTPARRRFASDSDSLVVGHAATKFATKLSTCSLRIPAL